MMCELSIATCATTEFVDITERVKSAVQDSGVVEGICTVYTPHTTTAITINEAADPNVAADLVEALERIVPDGVAWSHLEGNSPAHLKASLLGASVQVLIRDGQLQLGRWQGIFFCEFDGPRKRTTWVQVRT